MTTTTKQVMLTHDGTTLYYPAGPGLVFAITFAHLAAADGSDELFGATTSRTDLCPVIAAGDELAPLRDRAPEAWTNIDDDDHADHVADLQDAVEMWVDYCDAVVGAEDGELAA